MLLTLFICQVRRAPHLRDYHETRESVIGYEANMTDRKKPKKPSMPLGHIVFPKKGSARKVIEPLLENKGDLERAIVTRFLAALAYFEGRSVTDVEKCDPWPDFEGYENTNVVGIEVVELVNQQHNKLRRRQEEYKSSILQRLVGRLSLFSGLHITLDDGYQMPAYPKVNSKDGKEIVDCYVRGLLDCVDEIGDYDLGRVFIREWRNENRKPKVGIYGYRTAPREMNLPPHIGFLGTFPESLEKVRSLLAEAVEHKIDKSYTKYKKGKLLLLVYEVGTISVEPGNSEAIQRTQDVLQGREHPFDEVWYIFPYAESNFGAIHRVWPQL